MRKILCIFLLLFAIIFSLAACDNSQNIEISEDGYWVIEGRKTDIYAKGEKGDKGDSGEQGNDGETPNIEISQDGYWVINGIKTNVSAIAQKKEFVVGEEISFKNGEEFTLYTERYYDYSTGSFVEEEEFKITYAKIVAAEESNYSKETDWPVSAYDYSYKYTIYAKGYCPEKYAGKQFDKTILFRSFAESHTRYAPCINYIPSIVAEDGYFEFTVDVYVRTQITEAVAIGITDWHEVN